MADDITQVVQSLGLVTAYGYAKHGGYEGTEAEFEEDLAAVAAGAATATQKAADAADSASSAEDYATSASNYATAASGSATDAAGSATDAADYKAAALSAKNDAVDAKDAAVTAKTNAETAETGANTAKEAAVSAKNDAVSAKNAAVAAKESAEAYATTATDKATAAAGSATTAAGHAEAAEAWATGGSGGTASATNNAKAYAEDAAASAAEAAASMARKMDIPRVGSAPSWGTQGQLLMTNGTDAAAWTDIGTPSDMQVGDAVSAWLDAHPEATTTVEDGSIAEAKFTIALQRKTIKDYVTPEMFDAVGDGITDDSSAFQQAIDSGKPILLINSYYIKNVYLNSYTEIYGQYNTAIITQANEAAFIYNKNIERCIFDGFSIRGSGVGFKYVTKTDYYYFSNSIFRNLAFFADLSIGVNANIILCLFENCIFGYHGTPNPDGCSHIVVESREDGRQSTDNMFYGCRFYNATDISVKLEYSMNNHFVYCNIERNECSESTIDCIGGLNLWFDKCWIENNAGAPTIKMISGTTYPANMISISNSVFMMLNDASQVLMYCQYGKEIMNNCIGWCQNVANLIPTIKSFAEFTNNRIFNSNRSYDVKLPINQLDVVVGDGLIYDKWFEEYTSGTPSGWTKQLMTISAGDSAYKGTGIHYLCSSNGYNYIIHKIKKTGLSGKNLKMVYLANRTSGADDALRPCYSLDGETVSNFTGTTPLTGSAPKVYEYSFVAPADEFYVGLRCGGAVIEGNIYAFDVLYGGNTLINPVSEIEMAYYQKLALS